MVYHMQYIANAHFIVLYTPRTLTRSKAIDVASMAHIPVCGQHGGLQLGDHVIVWERG